MAFAHPARSVWYAAYGSNLSWERFRCYLHGGRPPHGNRIYPGSRDPSDPLGSRQSWLPCGFGFARQSAVWGGGVAFVDPQRAGRTPVRLWQITIEQFLDVFAQENRLEDPPGLDIEVDQGSMSHVTDSWYGSVMRAADHDSSPVLTFTAATAAPAAEPTLAYLEAMVVGLGESHGWDRATAVEHLCDAPGMQRWDPVGLVSALGKR